MISTNYNALEKLKQYSSKNFKKLLLENLNSISTDFTSGFHLSEDHLNAESSDRKE